MCDSRCKKVNSDLELRMRLVILDFEGRRGCGSLTNYGVHVCLGISDYIMLALLALKVNMIPLRMRSSLPVSHML